MAWGASSTKYPQGLPAGAMPPVNCSYEHLYRRVMHVTDRTKARLALAAAAAAGLVSANNLSAQVLYEPFDYTVAGTATNLSVTTAGDAAARYSTQGTYWAT